MMKVVILTDCKSVLPSFKISIPSSHALFTCQNWLRPRTHVRKDTLNAQGKLWIDATHRIVVLNSLGISCDCPHQCSGLPTDMSYLEYNTVHGIHGNYALTGMPRAASLSTTPQASPVAIIIDVAHYLSKCRAYNTTLCMETMETMP